MSNDRTKEQLLHEALKWALTDGISLSITTGKLYNSGCGCCSECVEPPPELRELVQEIRKEIIGG